MNEDLARILADLWVTEVKLSREDDADGRRQILGELDAIHESLRFQLEINRYPTSPLPMFRIEGSC